MKIAYEQALIAFHKEEVPVGVVIVSNDTILAKTFNQVQLLQDITAHAEILAITSASSYLGSKYLNNCILYTTLQPCIMCCGAIYLSKIDKVIIGSSYYPNNKKYLKKYSYLKNEFIGGKFEFLCSDLLINFFKKKVN